MSSLRRSCDCGWRARSSDWWLSYRLLSDSLHSKRWALLEYSFYNNQTFFIIFMILICNVRRHLDMRAELEPVIVDLAKSSLLDLASGSSECLEVLLVWQVLEGHPLKYYPSYYYYSTSKTLVKFEMQLWPWMKVNIIGLNKDYIDLSSDYVHSKLVGHCLNSFWNNQTYIIFTIKICVTLNEGQGQHN